MLDRRLPKSLLAFPSVFILALGLTACGTTENSTVTPSFTVENHLRAGKQTPLDDYIAKPDSTYRWELVRQERKKGYRTYLIDMTSQTWRSPQEVDRTQWQHWVSLVVPDEPCSDTALLLISGGGNGGEPPKKIADEALAIAKATHCTVAEVKMIPNQRLTFHGDGAGRSEDDLIGYTWDQYMETGDPTWLARFPMVKASVRAMDTVQSFLAQNARPSQQVEHFVVAGASKRGWTTWVTGAVDDRVSAIAPVVIDVLNVNASMRHHYAAYGFWAPAVVDYIEHNIFQRMDDPRLQKLYTLVDPYAYLDRLDIPKMIISGSGDEFFLPDSSRFYFDALPGEKHLSYVPNAGHKLNGDAVATLASFFKDIATNTPRPNINWNTQPDGSIRVNSDRAPQKVTLWQAHNAQARDFRLEMKGVYDNGYVATELQAQDDGSYLATPALFDEGWSAYFVEFEFHEGDEDVLRLTTDVTITPDVLPYANKDASQDNSVGPPGV